MISSQPALLEEAREPLSRLWGPMDIVSEVMPFDFTHYYDGQMGSPLHRQFVAFGPLAAADALAAVKQRTNELENFFAARYAGEGRPPRPINLDPGYIEKSKLVLASMKNFSHRIYVGGGVFAEVTLMYHKGRWDSLPWTFPDYASGRYHAFLTQARDRLWRQLTEEGSGS